nr:hypothetical protein [Pyramidobacter porci]
MPPTGPLPGTFFGEEQPLRLGGAVRHADDIAGTRCAGALGAGADPAVPGEPAQPHGFSRHDERTAAINAAQRESRRAVYDESPADGFWVPTVQAGHAVAASTRLGTLSDLNGCSIQEFRAQFGTTIMYYTSTLGVKRGDPLVAYAEFEENE